MSRSYFLLIMLAAGQAASAVSDTGYNLKFTGIIIPETCNVDSDSVQQTVPLGQFTRMDFMSTGDVTKSTAFNIHLTGCTRGIRGTQIWFTGTQDKNNPALLALTDTGMGTADGMATGVGVQILDNNQNPISINSSRSKAYPLQPGDNTLTFALRYKSTQPEVTAGNATAVMYFDLQYQ